MMVDKELSDFKTMVAGVLADQWGTATSAESGDLGKLWQVAAQQGWYELASSNAVGAVVAAMQELGAVACPLPLFDGFVAVRLLTGNDEVIADIERGALRVLVTHQEEVSATEASYLEGAAHASHVLTITSDPARAVLRPITSVEPMPGLAQPPWSNAQLGEPVLSVAVDQSHLNEAMSLMRLGLAARAMAAARRAHEMAVEHAKVRHQFGRPIGSFGAVQQRIASCHIDLGAGDHLLAEAWRGCEAGAEDAGLSVAIFTEHACSAAPRVQFGAHHTLAATGYFEEHEAPWLFRRVHADIVRLALYPSTQGDVADQLVELNVSLPAFATTAVGDEFRGVVREFLAANPSHMGQLILADDHELTAKVAERGWLGFAWPLEHGGREATIAEQVILNEEATYHGAGLVKALSSVTLLGNSILWHGSPEQKHKFLPLVRQGKMRFCLGYSEPEAGSDLASMKTSAVRDGGHWVINGQKLWTTGGDTADWVWLAVRTDPNAQPRHAGITIFLVPMDTPGITVQQHRALSGEISCSVFYDDVRIPDSARVGEVNGGWAVITDALAGERITMGGIAAALHRQLDDLLDLVRTDVAGTVGRRGSARRKRLAAAAVAIQATRALVVAAIGATGDGNGGGRLEAPMAGVLGGETAEEFGEAALDILGPRGALADTGQFEYALRLSVMYVVGGGTNDVQRGIIARLVGLPR
ncbi:acyl-CoA dehydrogenase family protein [Williamsia muralis]|uniref:acyl-CoA dehydrogenase family protein n=1 Tax=Williamsia marianensis TaxID=85044 RepID=UPI000E32A58F|nr:acyl-CoA dehydrogenase family protein [Williamsia marianensis]